MPVSLEVAAIVDDRIGKVNLVVAQEDIDILGELDPVQTPDSTTKEVLVPSDQAIVSYRDWLKKYDQKGWRIDTDAFKAKKGKVAMAIPCPARRTSGNWVIDAVPLVKASGSLSHRAGGSRRPGAPGVDRRTGSGSPGDEFSLARGRQPPDLVFPLLGPGAVGGNFHVHEPHGKTAARVTRAASFSVPSGCRD